MVLVEGISDRVFFEAVFDRLGVTTSRSSVLEIVDVGGKGFFKAYEKLLKACKIPYSIIADLDYVEEIGSKEIKAMFRLDNRRLKRSVIDDSCSLDGASLVANIEEAIKTGSWDHAKQTWEYIKGRHRRLKTDLDSDQKRKLRTFLAEKRLDSVYVLGKGLTGGLRAAGKRIR